MTFLQPLTRIHWLTCIHWMGESVPSARTHTRMDGRERDTRMDTYSHPYENDEWTFTTINTHPAKKITYMQVLSDWSRAYGCHQLLNNINARRACFPISTLFHYSKDLRKVTGRGSCTFIDSDDLNFYGHPRCTNLTSFLGSETSQLSQQLDKHRRGRPRTESFHHDAFRYYHHSNIIRNILFYIILTIDIEALLSTLSSPCCLCSTWARGRYRCAPQDW